MPTGSDCADDTLVFSVVIPALNEEVSIRRCLDSLSQQRFPANSFEVIVVDNGSSDRTVEIAESYKGALHMTVLVVANVHISALRNAGATASRGKILAFLDADMVVPAGWLMEAEKIFQHSVATVVGGPFSVPEGSSWVARGWFGRSRPKATASPSYIPSGNLMVTRSDFFRVGGFDESLQTSEDCDFCCRARELGLKMSECAAISVVHLGSPQTVSAFFRREMWHGTSVLRVFLRNFPTLQNSKPIFFTIYTLFCLVMTIVMAAGGALAGKLWLVLAPLGMLLAVPAALAWRTARRGAGLDFPGLFVLLFFYGIARAISVVGLAGLRRGRDLRPGQCLKTQPTTMWTRGE